MALRRLRFIQRRKALGHTQEELAILLGVDRSTVLRWERAETEPQPWQRPKLTSVLRVTAEELSELLAVVNDVPTRHDGYALMSSVPLDFALPTSRTIEVLTGFSAHDLASRRQVLQQLSVLTSVTLLQPIRHWLALPRIMPAVGVGVGSDELDELDQAVKLLRHWDSSGAGGLKRKAVVGQLNAVAETLAEVRDAATSRKLFQLTAELAQLAGWMSYDQGLPGVAQRYYLLSLHACRESGDVAFGAKVVGDMTQLSTAMGCYDDSLSLTGSGLYALPRKKNAPVRAELLGLEARAYAQLGGREASAAVRSAEACVEAWHEAGNEERPDWLHYMNQAEVNCLAANAYIQLALAADDRVSQQYYAERAERYTLHARRGRTKGYDRSRILDEIRLAKVRIGQAEPAESARVACNALAMAGRTRSGVVCDWLVRYNAALTSRYAAEPEVGHFTSQLRDYLRRAAPAREAEVVASGRG